MFPEQRGGTDIKKLDIYIPGETIHNKLSYSEPEAIQNYVGEVHHFATEKNNLLSLYVIYSEAAKVQKS